MGDVSANGNPLPAAVHLGYDSRDKLPSDAKDRLMKFFVDTADIDAIARDHGFQPETSADEGFPRFVDWFKTYHGIA